jgi:hypothetical protein
MDFVPPLVAVVVGAGVLALKVLLQSGRRAEDALADETWASAARRVGGVVHITPGSLFTSASRTIEVTVEGVAIVADTLERRDWSKRGTMEYTRVRTGFVPGMRAVSLRVWPRGPLSRVARSLGLSHVPTGDPEFDAVFSVTGSPRSVSAAFLDEATRRFLVGAAEGFESDDHTIRVEREGLPRQTSTLVDMIGFIQKLVQRWMTLGQGPAQVAEALGLEQEGPLDLAITSGSVVARGIRRGSAVTLALRIGEQQIATIVTSEVNVAQDWALERDDAGTLVDKGDRSGCPPAVLSVARGAPPALLALRQEGGTVELVLEGLSPDPEQVAGILDGVIDAVASGGGYR